MISIKECIDYADLTEDEVSTIAEHEHLPYAMAAHIACSLAQSEDGTEVLRCLLKNALCDAATCGRAETLSMTQRAYAQFVTNHPEH